MTFRVKQADNGRHYVGAEIDGIKVILGVVIEGDKTFSIVTTPEAAFKSASFPNTNDMLNLDRAAALVLASTILKALGIAFDDVITALEMEDAPSSN